MLNFAKFKVAQIVCECYLHLLKKSLIENFCAASGPVNYSNCGYKDWYCNYIVCNDFTERKSKYN